jgi:hypothetical protein
MAAQPRTSKSKDVTQLIPSPATQTKIKDYFLRVLVEHKKFTSYRDKMGVIDVAYARYKATKDSNGIVQGQGVDAATTPVGVMNLPSTTPPVVISQVDSMVGYLSEVFLSGYPLFPIVSNPSTKVEAEQLEVILDDHATIGGYARQLLLFIRDGVKYNFSAVEADWSSIEQYSIADNILEPGTDPKASKKSEFYTKLTRRDPYNTIWDVNVPPGDVAAEGDYAGYIEILSRTKTKRKLQRLADAGEAFNVREVNESSNLGSTNYYIHPQISDYVTARKPESGIDWYWYATGKKQDSTISGDNFEWVTLYVRLLPSEFSMTAPEPNRVQIWKLVTVNGIPVLAKRIISAYDYLPMLFGQPLEDGLGYQTQSIAESNIPFQQAAETLFNISFNAARRAVADRALYNPTLISPSDVNAPVPAAKIPVKVNSLSVGSKISDAYYQIPFDARGTEGALDSGMRIVAFGKELSGLNNPMQGQFQKGNKSVQEWNDTMGGADSRLRLPAITLEYQVFTPLKNILKLNIYQYGEDTILVSQKDGKQVTVDMAALRKAVLAFRVADGYTPKSKLASVEAITQGLNTLSQNQLLSQQYGAALPNIFAHLMQLAGVRGLEEYTPRQLGATQIAPNPVTPQQPSINSVQQP